MNSPIKKPNVSSLAAVTQSAVKQLTNADIRIDLIDIERQVRTDLGDLTSLAESIKARGVEVSIIVLAKDDGRFRLIAGERRLRASIIAGQPTIPAKIKRAQNAFQIRETQITENHERKGLTTFEEAMGVLDDVENFGFKEAQRIWNRSEAWVSKRVATKKFAGPVLDLMESDLCGDLEILHSLNQLHELSVQDFNYMVQQFKNSVPVTRDDVRAKVTSIRTWKKQEAELAERRKEMEAAAQVRQVNAAAATTTVSEEEETEPSTAPTTPPTVEGSITNPAAEKPKKSGKAKAVVTPAPVEPSPEAIAAEAELKRQQLEQRLLSLRKEVFEWGDANRGQVNSMTSKMQDLELDMNETEWVLWTGFQSMILPMLEALGDDRSTSYLKRLQSSLKGHSARDLWQQLHPLVPGSDPADEHGLRVAVPDKPDDWRF